MSLNTSNTSNTSNSNTASIGGNASNKLKGVENVRNEGGNNANSKHRHHHHHHHHQSSKQQQQQQQWSSNIVIEDKNDPEQVRKYAWAVCREYLGGAWMYADSADFEIKRIAAGLSNYLYVCEIRQDKFNQIDREPRRILLRLYGENNQRNSAALLKDIVVSAIMSDNQLGPKLYGLFSIGRLEEFISFPTMDQNDMYVPELSRSIARVMAKFHTLEMPLSKEPRWLFETIQKYMKQIIDVSFTNEADVKKYEKILSYDLDNEYKMLKPILKSINSPVVFCHNDINVGNILKLPNKLMIIDYEYGSYNYRGFDFGNHFCEWMMNNAYEKYPYYQYNYDKYPSRAQQIEFLTAYVDEFKRVMKETRVKRQQQLNKTSSSSLLDEGSNRAQHELDEMLGDASINNNEDDNNNNNNNNNDDDSNNALKNLNIEHLLNEANHFALASNILWIYWSICQAAVCKIKFDYLDYALARCDAYFRQKKALFPDGFNSTKSQ